VPDTDTAGSSEKRLMDSMKSYPSPVHANSKRNIDASPALLYQNYR
jgi:hypothetical protein